MAFSLFVSDWDEEKKIPAVSWVECDNIFNIYCMLLEARLLLKFSMSEDTHKNWRACFRSDDHTIIH